MRTENRRRSDNIVDRRLQPAPRKVENESYDPLRFFGYSSGAKAGAKRGAPYQDFGIADTVRRGAGLSGLGFMFKDNRTYRIGPYRPLSPANKEAEEKNAEIIRNSMITGGGF